MTISVPFIKVPHESDLLGDVSAPVGVGRLDDVLEDFVLALQHGAVVRRAGEERAVHLVALGDHLTVEQVEIKI